MSLHDVVIELLHGGFPKSETRRDELIAQVEADRRPAVVPDPPEADAPLSVAPRYDPATGERVE